MTSLFVPQQVGELKKGSLSLVMAGSSRESVDEMHKLVQKHAKPEIILSPIVGFIGSHNDLFLMSYPICKGFILKLVNAVLNFCNDIFIC